MGRTRIAYLFAVGLLAASAGPASEAGLPRAPPSRLIFDVDFAIDCGSNCDDSYIAKLTPAGHGRFRRLKQLFGPTPGFARDGHRAAYVDDHERLIVASVTTKRPHTVARQAIEPLWGFANPTQPLFGDTAPSWSPDGRRLAFVQDGSPGSGFITTIGFDGRGLRRLTEGRQPAWSPRGGIIAFTRGVSHVNTLYTVPANGGPEHALGPGEYPDWSPQGDALAFDRGGRILVAYPDGTHARKLAAGYMPRFSPDGRQIAFIHDNSAYVMGRDGDHKHVVADELDLADLDYTADAAFVIWLAWQPLLTSPRSASSSRQLPEATRSAVARTGQARAEDAIETRTADPPLVP
jgi:dipeptidyl aminopeptidase/acylaminoacyl peptidase